MHFVHLHRIRKVLYWILTGYSISTYQVNTFENENIFNLKSYLYLRWLFLIFFVFRHAYSNLRHCWLYYFREIHHRLCYSYLNSFPTKYWNHIIIDYMSKYMLLFKTSVCSKGYKFYLRIDIDNSSGNYYLGGWIVRLLNLTESIIFWRQDPTSDRILIVKYVISTGRAIWTDRPLASHSRARWIWICWCLTWRPRWPRGWIILGASIGTTFRALCHRRNTTCAPTATTVW